MPVSTIIIVSFKFILWLITRSNSTSGWIGTDFEGDKISGIIQINNKILSQLNDEKSPRIPFRGIPKCGWFNNGIPSHSLTDHVRIEKGGGDKKKLNRRTDKGTFRVRRSSSDRMFIIILELSLSSLNSGLTWFNVYLQIVVIVLIICLYSFGTKTGHGCFEWEDNKKDKLEITDSI